MPNPSSTQTSNVAQKGKAQVPAGKLLCKFCKAEGHAQRDCEGFWAWLAMKGTTVVDIVSNVDELLYVEFSHKSWWIDSGTTVHVTNSLQGFHSVRTLRKGEWILRVADGAEIKVMAVGELHLRPPSGINLLLHDVLYAPSIKRNLISVMVLINSGYDCNFSKDKCFIKYNNIVFG